MKRVETRQVWKYQLAADREFTDIEMPKGSDVLSGLVQHNQACIWVLVNDTTEDMETRRFYLVPTGSPMPADAGVFVGTLMLAGGALVFHVFERWSKL